MIAAWASIAVTAAQATNVASPPSPDLQPIETVVVTGERVPRALRETSSSVVVVTARELEALAGAVNTDDVIAAVPNVQFGSGGLGPTIRGQDSTGVLQDLPAFLGGTRPRVTLQVDGRAVSFSEFVFGIAPLWDIAQVEVFRSPQTTTQGRNSIGGAIFVRSEEPRFDWQAKARLLAGSLSVRQGSAMINAPLIDDQLAMRVSAERRRGRPSSKLADRVEGADPNEERHDQLRVRFLAEPNMLNGFSLVTSYVHTESGSPQAEGVRQPFREREDPSPGYGVFRTNVDSLTAIVTQRFSDALTATTTLSLGDNRIRRFAPPGLGETQSHGRDLSVEAIANWNPNDQIGAVGGLYWLRAKLDQHINLNAVLGTGKFDDRQRSIGLFGEAKVRPIERLSFTAGLRYQRDGQVRVGALGRDDLLFPIDFDGKFDAWLPKVSAAWDFSRSVTAGVMVQRSYNPGGTTLNFDTGEENRFGQETLWSAELFGRAAFANGRGNLSVNVFRNWFRDAQRARSISYRVPGGATAVWAKIENVPEARSHGFEAQIDWRIVEGLKVRAGIGHLLTKIVRSSDPANPIEGKKFARAPKFSGSLGIDWQAAPKLRLSGQARRHGDYFSNDANTPVRSIETSTVFDARAAYDVGRFRLFGYARNLTDKFRMTYLFSETFGTAGDPRELGIGIEGNY